MNDRARADDERVLSVHLDLHLEDEPISGRLWTDEGADERFVGWLGFIDALRRLQQRDFTNLRHDRREPR